MSMLNPIHPGVLMLCALALLCGCEKAGDAPVSYNLPGEGQDSVTWNTKIKTTDEPNVLVLSGNVSGKVQVTDARPKLLDATTGSTFPIPTPWGLTADVTIVRTSDAPVQYNVVFDGNDIRGSANTLDGAWDLARIIFVRQLRAQILLPIRGELIAPFDYPSGY